MTIEAKIESMRAFQNYLIDFLDNEDQSEENFQKICKFVSAAIADEGIESIQLNLLLKLVKNIFHNHHRSTGFNDKVLKILSIFLELKNVLVLNMDLLRIFKSDKKLLFLLDEKKDLNIEYYFDGILSKRKYELQHYHEFFDKKLCKEEAFNEKRSIGENDHPICQLIRNDSINEFIEQVNRSNISIKNYLIEESIYETNSFLLKSKPTLIEYAAFHGSIQIFKYLLMNGAELTPSLYIYAIHSKNPEIFHLLEEQKVPLDDKTSYKCLKEAIKCHHNDFAEYIKTNFINSSDQKKEVLIAIQYFNFQFYPSKFDSYESDYELFIYACKYGNYDVVKYLLSKGKIDYINYKIDCLCKNYENDNENVAEITKDDDEYKNMYQLPYDEFVQFNYDDKLERNEIRNKWKNKFSTQKVAALHFAVEKEEEYIVRLLLNHPNIDVNEPRIKFYDTENDELEAKREEKTALHIAIEQKNYDIFRYLCSCPEIDINKKTLDCYPSNDKTREMTTPLNISILNGSQNIMEVLVADPRIDVNKKSTFERWWNGGKEEYEEWTPLILAIKNRNYEIINLILKHPKLDVNKKIIDFYTRANLSYVYKRKEAALHVALSFNEQWVVNRLIMNKNIDVNDLSILEYRYYDIERLKQMKSPLYMLIENNDLENIKVLISKKRDLVDFDFGLLNIAGGPNVQYKIGKIIYNPKIRKDQARPTHKESYRRLDYLNLRKDNHEDDGRFSSFKEQMNNEKYLRIDEEEDICDELDFKYVIFNQISCIKAAKLLSYSKIENIITQSIANLKRNDDSIKVEYYESDSDNEELTY